MNNTEISTEADDITQGGISTEADDITQDGTIVVRPATENYEAMAFDYCDVSIRNKFEDWLQKSCKLVISNDLKLLVDYSYIQLTVNLGDWVVYDRTNDVIIVMSSEDFSRDWVRV